MAVAKSIRECINAINEEIGVFESTLQMIDAAAGDDTPPWYYVFRRTYDRLSECNETLETILVQKVIPLLDDFDAASR
jgi:hypothetical protein